MPEWYGLWFSITVFRKWTLTRNKLLHNARIGVVVVKGDTPQEAVALMHSLVDDLPQPIRNDVIEEIKHEEGLATRRRSSLRSVD